MWHWWALCCHQLNMENWYRIRVHPSDLLYLGKVFMLDFSYTSSWWNIVYLQIVRVVFEILYKSSHITHGLSLTIFKSYILGFQLNWPSQNFLIHAPALINHRSIILQTDAPQHAVSQVQKVIASLMSSYFF